MQPLEHSNKIIFLMRNYLSLLWSIRYICRWTVETSWSAALGWVCGKDLFTVFQPEICILLSWKKQLLFMAPCTTWAGEQPGIHLLLLLWTMNNLTPCLNKGQQTHYQSWTDSQPGAELLFHLSDTHGPCDAIKKSIIPSKPFSLPNWISLGWSANAGTQ